MLFRITIVRCLEAILHVNEMQKRCDISDEAEDHSHFDMDTEFALPEEERDDGCDRDALNQKVDRVIVSRGGYFVRSAPLPSP